MDDAWHSVQRVLVGFVIGTGIALLLATASLYSVFLRHFLYQIVEVLRPIPPIAFVPLSILWFGLGDPPAYFLVAFAAFFPAFTALLTSFDGVNQRYIDSARTLGASGFGLFRYIYFPAALPGIVSGLRVALGIAWFVVIVAEMVGAQSGLGYFIQVNRYTLNSANVLAGMLLIGLIGLGLNRISVMLTSSSLRWAVVE